MTHEEIRPFCSLHGTHLRRVECRECNASYQRAYLKRDRQVRPARAIWDQARKRAKRQGLRFTLRREAIIVPLTCPVLGIPIRTGSRRSRHSPSLDRIVPLKGYVEGNVRVISDHANRLKSNLDATQARRMAHRASGERRHEYGRIADYLDRELLLSEVRLKAATGGRVGEEWAKVAEFLDRAFIRAAWQG